MLHWQKTKSQEEGQVRDPIKAYYELKAFGRPVVKCRSKEPLNDYIKEMNEPSKQTLPLSIWKKLRS